MEYLLFGDNESILPVRILPLFHFPAGESLTPLTWPLPPLWLHCSSLLCRHMDFLPPAPSYLRTFVYASPGFRNSTLSSHPISSASQLTLSLLSTQCKEPLLPYAFPDHHQHCELSPLLYAPRIPNLYGYLYCLSGPIARKIHEGRNVYVFHSDQSSSTIKLVLKTCLRFND